MDINFGSFCFNKDKKILIGKRPPDKKNLANIWEFGCGQLAVDKTFEQCLVESYLRDFGTELSLGQSLIPVATYHMTDTKDQRKIPGVLFLAFILFRHGSVDCC